jgi:hypothetical protein
MALEKTEGYTSGEHFASEIIAALEKSRWGIAKPVPLVFYLFFALSFDGCTPQGTVIFHEGFKADGQSGRRED